MKEKRQVFGEQDREPEKNRDRKETVKRQREPFGKETVWPEGNLEFSGIFVTQSRIYRMTKGEKPLTEAEKGSEPVLTGQRKTLKNGKGGKKIVDMEKVYQQLDSGRSVKSVAEEWDVSPSTLYRRHQEYQRKLAMEEEEFPPLPEGIPDAFMNRI